MAHRHWIACYNMGSAGTTTKETIDLLDEFSEEELAAISDNEAEDYIAERAIENMKVFVKKA